MCCAVAQSSAQWTPAGECAAARLAGEKEALAAENKRLRLRVALLEKALFGPRSERLFGDSPEHPGQQVFEDLLKELDELCERHV